MTTSAPVTPLTLDEVLRRRRSVREFAPVPLDAAAVHRLLWAGQGITGPEGRRTAPSAGAQFAIELYAVTGDGVARYDPEADAVRAQVPGDRRPDLQAASAGQECVGAAPVTIVIVGAVERMEDRYGDLALGYLMLEAGHVGENILLEAVALGLGAVPCAKFDAPAVRAVLGLRGGLLPIELIPVGHPLG